MLPLELCRDDCCTPRTTGELVECSATMGTQRCSKKQNLVMSKSRYCQTYINSVLLSSCIIRKIRKSGLVSQEMARYKLQRQRYVNHRSTHPTRSENIDLLRLIVTYYLSTYFRHKRANNIHLNVQFTSKHNHILRLCGLI